MFRGLSPNGGCPRVLQHQGTQKGQAPAEPVPGRSTRRPPGGLTPGPRQADGCRHCEFFGCNAHRSHAALRKTCPPRGDRSFLSVTFFGPAKKVTRLPAGTGGSDSGLACLAAHPASHVRGLSPNGGCPRVLQHQETQKGQAPAEPVPCKAPGCRPGPAVLILV